MEQQGQLELQGTVDAFYLYGALSESDRLLIDGLMRHLYAVRNEIKLLGPQIQLDATDAERQRRGWLTKQCRPFLERLEPGTSCTLKASDFGVDLLRLQRALNAIGSALWGNAHVHTRSHKSEGAVTCHRLTGAHARDA